MLEQEEQDMNLDHQQIITESSSSRRKRKTANEAAGKKKAAGRGRRRRRKELITIEEMEERRKKKNERDRRYRAARKADYIRLKELTAVTHNNNKLDAAISSMPKRLRMVSLERRSLALESENYSLRLESIAIEVFSKLQYLKYSTSTNIYVTLESDGMGRFRVYENGYTREVHLETSHRPWESNIVINISSQMNVEQCYSLADQIWDLLKSPSPQCLEFPMTHPNDVLPNLKWMRMQWDLYRQINSCTDRISVKVDSMRMGRFSSKKQNSNYMRVYDNGYTEFSSWGDQIRDMLKTPSPPRLEFPMTNNPNNEFPPPTQQLRILEPMEAVEEDAPKGYDDALHSSFIAQDNNMQVSDIIAGTIPGPSHLQPNCISLADQILSMLSEVDDERDLSAAAFGFDITALDMMTDFAEYRIPTIFVSTAASLFPTISQSHRVTKSRKSLRTCAFILLCAAVLNIESTSFSNMSVDAFRKWRDAIDEADSVGFNVEILRSGLMRVAKAYLGHMKGSLYMNEQNMAEMSNSLTHAEEVSRQTEVELHLVMQRAEDSRTNIAFIKGEISRLSSEQDRLMSLDICNEGASEECMRLRTMFDATPGHFTNWN